VHARPIAFRLLQSCSRGNRGQRFLPATSSILAATSSIQVVTSTKSRTIMYQCESRRQRWQYRSAVAVLVNSGGTASVVACLEHTLLQACTHTVHQNAMLKQHASAFIRTHSRHRRMSRHLAFRSLTTSALLFDKCTVNPPCAATHRRASKSARNFKSHSRSTLSRPTTSNIDARSINARSACLPLLVSTVDTMASHTGIYPGLAPISPEASQTVTLVFTSTLASNDAHTTRVRSK